jgi:hypothetical protein
MRRIVLGIGVLVLGFTASLWTTAPSSAGRGGHGGGGHFGGGAHYAGGGVGYAHTGSVHYGAREDPIRHDVVRPDAVRFEHYAGLAPRGVYRNPYHDDYFRRFRTGYFPLLLGGAQYYGYYDLPLGCSPVVLNGATYYYCDGVYYQPYMYGGQTVYLVAPLQ